MANFDEIETLPPLHVIDAALNVAAVLDISGAATWAVRLGYIHYPSGGQFPPEDLRRGEELLHLLELVNRVDDRLVPTDDLVAIISVRLEDAREALLRRFIGTFTMIATSEELSVTDRAILIAIMPEADRREAALLRLAYRFDRAYLERLGLLGEETVCEALRADLLGLGYPRLADAVRRVSAISDQLGYDIVAPMITTGVRRLEVKATGRWRLGLLTVFLTRNEFDVGERDPSWSLVVCRVAGQMTVEIVGWCKARALRVYLPADGPTGKWELARLEIPQASLVPGVPPAI